MAMLKCMMRGIHTPLRILQNQERGSTGVVFASKNKIPRWLKLNTSQEADLKEVKSIWSYPRSGYERLLVVLYEEDLFSPSVKAISNLQSRKIERADFFFPRTMKQEQMEIIANTSILANYKYNLKTAKKEDFTVKEVNFVHEKELDSSKFNSSVQSAYCSLYARDLCNTRGSVATPSMMAETASELANSHSGKVSIEIIKGEELKEKGMNLLYNVGKSASSEPHLVLLKYIPDPNAETVALVGKGVTFDTGGLNLKPTNYIETMYMDKGGACATLGAFKWAVETGIPKNVVCTLALAENSIDSNSYKPSDILTSLNGLTVEIGNTDAEGRLCLADAFTYTQQTCKPNTVINLATLTGAIEVALGSEIAGIFGNDKKLIKNLIDAGAYYKENLWEMPISKEHKKSIEGDAADISNTGKSKYGGACTAAAFLMRFIEDGVKWAHIDIAGPAMGKKARDQFPSGATGFGVQLLTKYLS